jgi:hypothetical protein
LGKVGILAKNLEYLGKIWMDYLLKEKWKHGKFGENLGKIGILGKNLGKVGILGKILGKIGILAKN